MIPQKIRNSLSVIPVKTGIQRIPGVTLDLDTRFRGYDDIL